LGVDLKDLLSRKPLELEELKGKVIAIDGFNALYQFLSIIRGADGQPLKDRSGRITGHLSGLLYRNSNLLEMGVKPVYVFDGMPPSLKEVEISRRRAVKEEAVKKYEEAIKRGDVERARTYAQATAHLKDEMVQEAKTLLALMGIPWVQAPSEGEAQAAHLTVKGDAWAVGSQDYDSLLFGATRLVRNLTISGKRKLPNKPVYVKISPELIELKESLAKLGITRTQLIDMSVLMGTDFNPDGLKGVGPKTAIKMIKERGCLENMIHELRDSGFTVDPLEIRGIFTSPKVTDDYQLRWKGVDVEGVVHFLCHERDFNEERVKRALDKTMGEVEKVLKPPTLDAFLRS